MSSNAAARANREAGRRPHVAVVVVTYRSEAQIAACLDSLRTAAAEADLEIVVVDNGSGDGTVDLVRGRFPEVRVEAQRENLGFAAGCNRGLAATNSELVLFLNPDARLRPGTLSALIEHLAEHPEVGIVGPALEAPDGSLQRDISATGLHPGFRQALFEYTRLGRWFPRSRWVRDYFLVDFDRRSTRPVAMVQGACLATRREVLDAVGAFDERFFLYFEETDLCKRVIDSGRQVHYLGEVAAVHDGSGSSPDRRPSARHFIRSMYRFHRKHYGLLEAAALWSILAPYHVLKTVRMSVTSLGRPDDQRLRADLLTVAQRCQAHFGMMLGRW